MQNQEARSLTFMPQLDGLRGLCILGVFWAHFVTPNISVTMPWGTAGVRAFFVLSGFLITSILMKSRRYIDQGEQSVGFTLKHFYLRRGLRIIVLFYAWILVTSLLSVNLANRALADLLYVSNFYDIFVGGGDGNHYWSLAIEEQFYLLWPLLILVVPVDKIRKLILFMIVAAIATRLVMALNHTPYMIVKKFTPCAFDALGLGALIAEIHQRPESRLLLDRLKRIAAVVGIPLTILALVSLRLEGKGVVYTATIHTGLAFLSTAILIPAIHGYRGTVGKLLELQSLRYLGQISYGLYLMHLFVKLLCDQVAARVFPEGVSWVLMLPVYIVCTITVASVSWYWFESPINRLKTKFPMRQRATETPEKVEGSVAV